VATIIVSFGNLNANSLPDKSMLCPQKEQSVLAYQQFFTDLKKNELWLDENRGSIKGTWIKNSKASYLSGERVGKNGFYFCEYSFQSQDAIDIHWGTWDESRFAILYSSNIANNPPIDLQPSPGIDETRNYDLQYKTFESLLYLRNKVVLDGTESCGLVAGYFQILGTKLPASIEKINKVILDQFDSWARPKSEIGDCYEAKEFPKKIGLSISKMFASDKFVSIKVDFSGQNGSRGDLKGKTVNYDLQTSRELKSKDIFTGDFDSFLIAEMKKRIAFMYGESGRFNSIQEVDFSFTAQTLVASFVPVDAKGWYLEAYRIDIPIPLNLLKPYFKKSGPFVQNEEGL
jgi:hypothetical protein